MTEGQGSITIGLLAEDGLETRVAMLPDHVRALQKLNAALLVETGAGKHAYASDDAYKASGAEVASRDTVMQQADILLKINPPDSEYLANLPEGKVWISLMHASIYPASLEALNKCKATVLSLDAIPRISRAQTMDVLSSQANIAGYKASILAAANLPRFFPMLTTAAGSIPPAKVLVVGAGVAGLQAIATARRLGAVVEAFDVRAAVKEEVQSLGATFVEVEGAQEESNSGYAVEQSETFRKKQTEVLQEHAARSDVIITTAQIPGKQAPCLITRETIENMQPGSVIIDLAASTGGNCEMTQKDETIRHNDVTIIGHCNLPGELPRDASKMFGRNVTELLKLIIQDNTISINTEDAIIQGCCLARDGQLTEKEKAPS